MLHYNTELYPLCGVIDDITMHVNGCKSTNSNIFFYEGQGCNFMSFSPEGNLYRDYDASFSPPHESIDKSGIVSAFKANNGVISFTWHGVRTNPFVHGLTQIPYMSVRMHVKFHKKGHFDFICMLLRDINPKYAITPNK